METHRDRKRVEPYEVRERVNQPKSRCSNPKHFSDVIIMGNCIKCGRKSIWLNDY